VYFYFSYCMSTFVVNKRNILCCSYRGHVPSTITSPIAHWGISG